MLVFFQLTLRCIASRPRGDYKTGMKFLWLPLLFVGALNAHAGFDPRFEPFLLDAFSQGMHLRDESLPRLESVRSVVDGNRESLWVTLNDADGDAFRIRIVGPKGFRDDHKARPFLFISAGFFSGTEPVELMKENGDVLVAAFEYTPDTDAIFRVPERLARLIKSIPARQYFAVSWLQSQAWVRHDQFHILGVSLGGLFLPVTLRLLETNHVPFASFIDAFSGAEVRAPFNNILAEHVGIKGVEGLTDVIATITTPYDPSVYLPAIHGPKLVIHGSNDEVFTPDISGRLDATVTGPKMTCVVKGRHIDMDRAREVELTAGVLKAWVGAMVSGNFPQVKQPDTTCKTQF